MRARRLIVVCAGVWIATAVGCVNETDGGGAARGQTAALDETGDEPRATGLDTVVTRAEDPLPGEESTGLSTEPDPSAVAAGDAGDRNFGHAVPADLTELRRARSDLLRRRAERLDECLGEVYAAFADRPFAVRNARANEVARRVVDGDAVMAMEAGDIPTAAQERARVRRILRETGVR